MVHILNLSLRTRQPFNMESGLGHVHALDRFVDESRGAGPQVCGVDDAALSTRVAFAAVRSAAERRPVRLEEVYPAAVSSIQGNRGSHCQGGAINSRCSSL